MNFDAFVEGYLAGATRDVAGKIPWHRPDFSRRMLREHLSQEHDLASRRFSLIDEHVAWIHAEILGGRESKILDLGCGPGLYCERLAALGHTCTGIDFSPASIDYARGRAAQLRLKCDYVESNLLTAAYGAGFDLVMMLFAELNTFDDSQTRVILSRVADALRPGGALLVEIHTPEHVESIGRRPRTWSFHGEGLFGDRPHLLLREAAWDESSSSAIESYFVVHVGTLEVDDFRSTTYRVTREQMRQRLLSAELGELSESAGLSKNSPDPGMYALVARKRATP